MLDSGSFYCFVFVIYVNWFCDYEPVDEAVKYRMGDSMCFTCGMLPTVLHEYCNMLMYMLVGVKIVYFG